MSQVLNTVNGDTYSGSLYVYYTGCCSDPNVFFNVLVNNTSVLSLGDNPTGNPASPPPANNYSRYFFSFTGTGSDTLTLEGNTTPGEWYVDDVVVTGAAGVATPEPSFFFVLAGALSAVVFWRIRRSHQVSR